MRKLLTGLFTIVIVVHLLAFVIEVFLWMNPAVHEFALNKFNASATTDLYEQALILKTLIVNQGFYNLLLA